MLARRGQYSADSNQEVSNREHSTGDENTTMSFVSEQEPMCEKGAILVVDDDTDICNLLQQGLRGFGHEIVLFNNGAEALQWLNDRRIVDLIISDFVMPGMDGIAFFVQAHRHCPDAKRLLLTGAQDFKAFEYALLNHQIDLYIAKPCSLASLRQEIRRLCPQLTDGCPIWAPYGRIRESCP